MLFDFFDLTIDVASVFDLYFDLFRDNRIDSRARGNAAQMLDKFKKMAQDAQVNGDRVQAEYYHQFADHYFRVNADTIARREEQRIAREESRPDNRNNSNNQDDYGDNDGDSDRLEGLLGSDKNDPNSIPDIGLLIVENGGMAELSFNTGVGVLYRVHNRSNLESRVRDWNKLLGPLAGDGTRMEFILPIDVDRKFFGVSFELAPLP